MRATWETEAFEFENSHLLVLTYSKPIKNTTSWKISYVLFSIANATNISGE